MATCIYIMTYREQLDQLLHDATVKAAAYLEAVRQNGQHDVDITPAKEGWEQAEQAYETCFDMIRSNAVRLDDEMG